MKTYFQLALVLMVTVGISAEAQLIFPDSTQQGSAGVTFVGVKVISVAGTDIARGTALRNELAAQAATQTVAVLLLDPGNYDIGSTALDMVDFVNVQGFSASTTRIIGSGSVVINGANFMEIHNIEIQGSANASTVVLQSGGEMTLMNSRIQHNGNGTGTNFGVRILNGGSLELIGCTIQSFPSGNSGSLTGLQIVGDNGAGTFSQGIMTNSSIELGENSGTMTLTALAVGNGSTTPGVDNSVAIEIFGGIIAAEGGSSNTAISVGSDADVFITNGCVETTGTALTNGRFFAATNTVFDGVRGSGGTTVYSQCSAFTASGPAPITNSFTSIP